MATDAEMKEAARIAKKEAAKAAIRKAALEKQRAEIKVSSKLVSAGVDTNSEDGAKKKVAGAKLEQNEVFKFIKYELPNLLSGKDGSGVSLGDKIVKLLDGTRQKQAAQNDSYNEAAKLANELKGVFGAEEFVTKLEAEPKVDAPSADEVDNINKHAAMLLASKKKLSDDKILEPLIQATQAAIDAGQGISEIARYFGVVLDAEASFELKAMPDDSATKAEYLLKMCGEIYAHASDVA